MPRSTIAVLVAVLIHALACTSDGEMAEPGATLRIWPANADGGRATVWIDVNRGAGSELRLRVFDGSLAVPGPGTAATECNLDAGCEDGVSLDVLRSPQTFVVLVTGAEGAETSTLVATLAVDDRPVASAVGHIPFGIDARTPDAGDADDAGAPEPPADAAVAD
jgi:hypothetical protein